MAYGARGNLHGSALVGAVAAFLAEHGPAAGHEVIARLSPEARALVLPNAATLGVMRARSYPYPFVGELVRAMQAVARADEDAFLRKVTVNGVSPQLALVARLFGRFISPAIIAEHGQTIWNTFHDAGVLKINPVGPTEQYEVVEDWPNHDPTVCKLGLEARKLMFENLGIRTAMVTRERCQAWGHPQCAYRVRW
jgi:hypothetical protein